jgi:hypothetical protein
MPTATDQESHAIKYSCTSTEPSVSYDSATKMISFAATTTKVTTPINLSLNAKDEEIGTAGTTATLAVSHNSPPKYTTAPEATVLIDHSDFTSQDIVLPPRNECADPES